MSEQLIVKSILSALDRLGVFAWRNNTGRRGGVSYGFKGSPDIIGVMRGGRACFIEVKTATGKQSAEQVEFQRRIQELGGLYVLARNVDDVWRGLGIETEPVVCPRMTDAKLKRLQEIIRKA